MDKLLKPLVPDGLIVAVSGGADSRALLEAMALWEGRHLGKVVVATIDHDVRPSSQKEGQWVVGRARSLGFAAVQELLLGAMLQGEHGFRNARYDCLRKIAVTECCKSIVLAHNRDDDAEGFMMSLIGKGGGSLGAAMDALTHNHDGIRIVRPFLSLSKTELLQFLTLHGYTNYVRDNHDLEQKNERAKVRFGLMPTLVKKDPHFMARVQRYAQRQRDINSYFDEQSQGAVTLYHTEGAHQATLDPTLLKNPWALETTIKWTLKKLAPHRDMRSSEPTILRILQDFSSQFFTPAGLDQPSNLFKVNLLEEKHYQFPGVLVRTSGNKLVFTLI